MNIGKSINKEQLQNRNGVFYEINKKTPYTGKVIGYYENRQIKEIVNLKDGLEEVLVQQ